MATSANITCYIQPTTAQCAAMAWVDTGCTAVIRREVKSAAEAEAVFAEARNVARAMGRPVAIKKLVSTHYGDRAPAGVKRMQGSEVVA